MQLFSISFCASFSVANADINCTIHTFDYRIEPGTKSAMFIAKFRSHYYSSLVSRYHLAIQKIQTSKELYNHINKFCFLELLLSYYRDCETFFAKLFIITDTNILLQGVTQVYRHIFIPNFRHGLLYLRCSRYCSAHSNHRKITKNKHKFKTKSN